MSLKSVSISPDKKVVRLIWTDGYRARFHALWLRDNALDAKTRSEGNGQRLISVLDFPFDLKFSEATTSNKNSLSVSFVSENQKFEFPSDWLRKHVYDHSHEDEDGWLDTEITTWNSDLQGRLPSGNWNEVSRSRSMLANWLAHIKQYGFAILSDLPKESGAVCQVAETFGFVRETNYGRWFDVRAEVNPQNLAYTNMGLQAHTDNPYREPVPTLQILACLESSVQGGDSIVVDGFRVAQNLKALNPHGFLLLAQYNASFEFSGSQDVHLSSHAPMIGLARDGELKSVRFNNRSAAPFTKIPYNIMEDYYKAYRQFASLVEDPLMQISFKLSPGELFVVDNTRVLHARKSFSGSGQRWLQGCYADKDGLLSTLSVIEKETKSNAQR